jgi:hypothetical protein
MAVAAVQEAIAAQLQENLLGAVLLLNRQLHLNLVLLILWLLAVEGRHLHKVLVLFYQLSLLLVVVSEETLILPRVVVVQEVGVAEVMEAHDPALVEPQTKDLPEEPVIHLLLQQMDKDLPLVGVVQALLELMLLLHLLVVPVALVWHPPLLVQVLLEVEAAAAEYLITEALAAQVAIAAQLQENLLGAVLLLNRQLHSPPTRTTR